MRTKQKLLDATKLRYSVLVFAVFLLGCAGAGRVGQGSLQETTAIVSRVADGDSVELMRGLEYTVDGEAKSISGVRYIGVNAPEYGEPFYKAAWELNRSLVFGKRVRLEFDQDRIDRYGRLLAYVYVGDTFVNEEIVTRGYARADRVEPNTKYADLFEQLEKEAKEQGKGMWSSREAPQAEGPDRQSEEKEGSPETQEEYKYVASQKSQVYHELTCEWAQKIAPANRVYFKSIEEAEASGRRPCKLCRPDEAAPQPLEERTEPKRPEPETQPRAQPELPTMPDRGWWDWDTLISIAVVTTIAVVTVIFSYLWKSRRAYSKASPGAVRMSPVAIRRDARIPARLADWLYDHFASLTVDQQKHLARLRDEYKRFPHADQRAEYGPTWEMDSRKIRAQRPFCEVCGRRSEHVHHRHYRSSQPDPVDVVSLCAMCHYFIHPQTRMTREAFEKYKKG